MKKLLLLLTILLFSSIAHATSSITSTTGVVVHAGQLTISGNLFGTKTNYGEGRSQLNWIWDNAEDYSSFTDAGWTGGTQCVPCDSGAAYNITYSGDLTASQATSVSTKYITGCHYPNSSYGSGANVVMFAGGTETFTKFYARWYYYEESPFTHVTTYNQAGTYDIRNNKNFVLQDRDSLYEGGTGTNYAYIDNQDLALYTTDWAQIWIPNDYPSHTGRTIHHNGFGTTSGSSYGSIPNGGRAGYWELWEVIGQDLTSSGTSSIQVYIDGLKKIDITSSNLAFSAKGIGIGGYRDRANSTAFRKYFDDIYIDKDWARVVVGNNEKYDLCTVREIQIPHHWSDSAVGITVNQGSFETDDKVYLWVIDSDGNVSDYKPLEDGAQGYPVTIGGEGATDTTAPAVSGRDPAPDENAVPITSDIVFHLTDAGDGVDQATITCTVEGNDESGDLAITGTSADYTCTLSNGDLDAPLAYGQEVNISITASDLNSNAMETVTYKFYTETPEPPNVPVTNKRLSGKAKYHGGINVR